MIAPNMILTAGHCVLNFNDERKIAPVYNEGDPLLVQNFDGPIENPKHSFIVKVLRAVPHPSWVKAIETSNGSADTAANTPGVSDIGVLLLDQNLPIEQSELPPAGVWDHLPEGTLGLLVFGAGCQERGADRTMGTMKAALYTEIQRYPTRVETKPMDAITGAPAGPCKRDSGGGGFLVQKVEGSENRLTLAAVASMLSGTLEQVLAPAPTGMFLARIDKPEVLEWIKTIRDKKSPSTVAIDVQPHQCIAMGQATHDSVCHGFQTKEECVSKKSGASCVWE
jgi:hypothetical protein